MINITCTTNSKVQNMGVCNAMQSKQILVLPLADHHRWSSSGQS